MSGNQTYFAMRSSSHFSSPDGIPASVHWMQFCYWEYNDTNGDPVNNFKIGQKPGYFSLLKVNAKGNPTSVDIQPGLDDKGNPNAGLLDTGSTGPNKLYDDDPFPRAAGIFTPARLTRTSLIMWDQPIPYAPALVPQAVFARISFETYLIIDGIPVLRDQLGRELVDANPW
jgi:hypothetical protein